MALTATPGVAESLSLTKRFLGGTLAADFALAKLCSLCNPKLIEDAAEENRDHRQSG